ncbi:MAG: hypothetical protein ACK5W9_08355, partial [Bdellovibrionales bacterium]
TYASPVVDGIQNVPVLVTPPTLNQVLKYNGAAWAPANESMPADASYTTKGAVQFLTDQATSGIQVVTGVASLPNLIAAGGPIGNGQTIPVITYDAKGRLTAVATANVDDNTKLSKAGGAMTGNLDMGNQNITNAANVSSTGVGLKNLTVFDADSSNFARIQVTTILTANYNLTLPNDDGEPGHVLSTNGLGGLSWVPPSTGGLSSLNGQTGASQNFAVSDVGITPLISSAGNTHTLQIPRAVSAGVTAGTISNTDYTNFSNKLSSIAEGNGINAAPPNIVSVDAGLGINQIPQVGGAALGASGVVIANGTATALTSINCSPGQALKFDATTAATCGPDLTIGGTEFVNGGNIFGGPVNLGTNDGNLLNFETDNIVRMTIASNGSVGIGTTAPTRPLHVNGPIRLTATAIPTTALIGDIIVDSGDSNKLKFYDGSTWQTAGSDGSDLPVIGGTATAPGYSFIGDTNTGLYSSLLDNLQFSTNGLERMRIDAAGNIGIGTTTPNSLLTISSSAVVAGTIATFPLRIVNSGSTLNLGANPTYGEIIVNGGNPLIINSPFAEGSGGVVIGNAAPVSNVELLVSGQIISQAPSVTGSTADFKNGNIITLTSPSSSILLLNMHSGGEYTLITANTSAQIHSFSACPTGGYYFSPPNGSTTALTRTVYKIIVANSGCYVDWKSGFQ